METKEDTTESDQAIVEAVREEKTRLITKLSSEAPHLASKYKQQVKHTGGMLSTSMCYAYEKGILYAIKTLTKE